MHPRAALLCALPLVAGAAACGTGQTPQAGGTLGMDAALAPPSTLTATRWWSVNGEPAGSTIDPQNPTAGASTLQRSRTDYCRMLRQTLVAGKSILPGVSASDPALLASTRAFIADLQAVAPTSIAPSWRVVGNALIAVVASSGEIGKVHGIDAAAVQKATSGIALDAKRNCHLDLSSRR